MPGHLSCQQIRRRIFIRLERDTPAKDVFLASETIHPAVERILYRLNETAAQRCGNILPAGKDERIANPVEHPSDRNTGVLDICVPGVDGRLIAPYAEAADDIEACHNAVAVQLGRLERS